MTTSEPGRDCTLCPRLAAFRTHWRGQEPDWFNAPVPSLGSEEARVLVVGLAPGLRGANRTGRPFTGDFAGGWLYGALLESGLATGRFEARPDDSLRLADSRITNAVRCVPPENKPTPEEISTCRPFLAATLAEMPNLVAILALGKIAHDSTLRALGIPASRFAFAHGARHALRPGLTLFDTYHSSRYNANTGRLTEDQFRAVVRSVRQALG